MRTFRSRRSLLCAALAALLAVPAQARKPPRNPRWGKKKPAAAQKAPAAAAVSTAAAAAETGPAIPRLPPGRWKPEIKRALEEFAAVRGKDSPKYDDLVPPAAVLSFNDVAVSNDVGLAVFQRLVDRADFKFSDDFWREVPLVFGRQRLRAAYQLFIDQPVSTWPDSPPYHQYRKGFFKAYRDMCGKLGYMECRTWLAKLLLGYKEEELVNYTMATIGAEYLRPLAAEAVRDSPDDPDPVTVRHGLSWVPEIRALVDFLRQAGFDVHAVEGNEQHEFEVVAAQAGFDATRVHGIRTKLVNEKLGSAVLPPVPTRGGKANMVASRVGRAPALIVGSGIDDKEMLEYAGGLRILLDRGDASLLRVADEKGWLVQPAFAPVPNP